LKFLLINPPSPLSESASPSLGLAFIAGALERAGVEVRVLDLVVFPYDRDRFEALLAEFQPRFVGLTAVTLAFDTAVDVVRDIKAVDPDILTVMGGPHVSFCAGETMRDCPEIDFIVLKEGEETVVELVRAVDRGRDLAHVPGLVYREDGQVKTNGYRPFQHDLSLLPRPNRHLMPLGRYRTLGLPVTMTTSRGCPFKCIFCVGRNMVGSRVRYWDVPTVVDEIEYLSALGFWQVHIADDLFTANKKRCHAVCDGIMQRGLKVNWATYARVDTVSVELLEKMRAAGCTGLLFGVESASPDILRLINKRTRPEQVVEAFKMCVDAGITPCASFILGLPGETKETLVENQEFGERLKDLGAVYGFHFLVPFPGTRVRKEKNHFGIKILTDDWREYNANRCIVVTEGTTPEMLDEIGERWDREINEYYQEVRERAAIGQVSQAESDMLFGMDGTQLTYELMMNRLLEEQGEWSDPNDTAGQALNALADKAAASTGRPRELAFRVLDTALSRKNLEPIRENGRVHWAWVDYLD